MIPKASTGRFADYLLREIPMSPYLFRLKPGRPLPTRGPAGQVVAYLREHHTGTARDVFDTVAGILPLSYPQVQALIVRMVDRGTLEIVGQRPLEDVDLRYERVLACDLCGVAAARHPIVFWKHGTPVMRCTSCGLLYANPRWKAEHLFSAYSPDYWASYTAQIQPTAADAAANLARWDAYFPYMKNVRATNRVLDIGCASGEFLDACAAHDWEGYGLESSPIGAALAASKHPDRIHVGTLDTVPWPDGWFDVVSLWDVLEHLQSPRAYVERIARLVRPGGMFCLTTPNIRSLSYGLLGPDWWVVGPNNHIYYFAPRTLTRLLTQAGFAIHAMGCFTTEAATWTHWLHYPVLRRLAPLLHQASRRVPNRLLWGDELVVIARRAS